MNFHNSLPFHHMQKIKNKNDTVKVPVNIHYRDYLSNYLCALDVWFNRFLLLAFTFVLQVQLRYGFTEVLNMRGFCFFVWLSSWMSRNEVLNRSWIANDLCQTGDNSEKLAPLGLKKNQICDFMCILQSNSSLKTLINSNTMII
jgi:hypothetical protein